jgi:hypothetical protein
MNSAMIFAGPDFVKVDTHFVSMISPAMVGGTRYLMRPVTAARTRGTRIHPSNMCTRM